MYRTLRTGSLTWRGGNNHTNFQGFAWMALGTSFIMVLLLQQLPHLSVAQSDCSWTGSNCNCDGGYITGDSCEFSNAAACLAGCSNEYEKCGNICQANQEDCNDNCVDIESLSCVCNCQATAINCRNSCTRARDTCSCNCEPPTKSPTRAPIKQSGSSPSTPGNNDGATTSSASSVLVPTTTAAISAAASSAITVTLFAVLWTN